jgi:hypothetical protein
MNRPSHIPAFALTGLLVLCANGVAGDRGKTARVPFLFERNLGQAPEGVDFLARQAGGQLLFGTPERLILHDAAAETPAHMSLIGARPVRAEALDPVATRVHYFLGNRPGEWVRNVPTFQRIVWRGVYPGIDVIGYARDGRLEYDFIVGPGADPSAIRLRFEGVRRLSLDEEGGLLLRTPAGFVRHRAPVIYQVDGDRRVSIEGSYHLVGEGEVGFRAEAWDPSRALIIDPVVEFSTFLGGDGSDYAYAIDEAPDGGVVIAGSTTSPSFLGVPPGNALAGETDIFVCKLTADGSQAEFLVYVGGSGFDNAAAVEVAPDGTLYVGGSTTSADFPLVNPIRSALQGGKEECLLQLSADGASPLWSTFFGGNGIDELLAMRLDGSGNCCFAGLTTSSDIPMVNAFQAAQARNHLTVLAPDRTVLASTYLGTVSTYDCVRDIALDPQDNVLVVGETLTNAFPVHRAYQPASAGGWDSFLLKVKRSDWSLDFSTYLGGSSNDLAKGVAVDSASRIYVTGYTSSTDFPLAGALEPSGLPTRGFLSRFSSDGQSLPFSTYLGGESTDDGLIAVDVNANDEAVVAGWTRSTITTLGWERMSRKGRDVLVARLAQDASAWREIAVFGGGGDNPQDIHVTAGGDILICGWTSSNAFPVARAFQPVKGLSQEGFVTRLSTNTVRQVPYTDDFEFGYLDARWRNRVNALSTTLFTPHSGKVHLRFTPRPNNDPGRVDLALDLSGRSGVSCSFWHMSATPQRHIVPLPAVFTNTCLGNGVAFSANGVHWFRLASTTQADGLSTNYTQRILDLDAAVAAAGLDYSQPLHLRFQASADTGDLTYMYLDDLAVVGTTLSFREGAVNVTEGSNAVLTVVREGPNLDACSVAYSTLAGTAVPGTDYTAATGTLDFAEGQLTNQFAVSTLDNAIEDSLRTFTVVLRDPVGVDLGLLLQCQVNIHDNDESLVFPVRCGFESGVLNPAWEVYTEANGRVEVNANFNPPEGDRLALLTCSGMSSNNGLAELTLPIDLAGRTNVYVRFHAARTRDWGDNADMVMPSTFTGHGRYVGVALSADGTTWHKVRGLSTLEGVGSTFQLFEIALDPLLAALGLAYTDGMRIKFCMGNTNPAEHSWLLLDLVEVFSPCFDFEPAAHTHVEYDGTLALTVLRKGSTAGAASVAYATRNGTALAGSDFTATSGTLSFDPGQVSNTVHVTLSNDAAAESNEVFYVDLSAPSAGFAVGIKGKAAILVQDDDRGQPLPFQDHFATDLSAWATHADAKISSGSLRLDRALSSDPPSAAMLAVDPAGATNLVLRFRAYYYFRPTTPMPNTYTRLTGGDGVSFSADGVTWHKLVAFEEDAEAWRSWRNADVALDPLLAAAGITPGTPFKLRFEAHTPGFMVADDVILFSRMPLGIAPVMLPGATGMVAYAASLTSSNAAAPAAWSVVDGLPGGLVLSAAGQLAGAPTEEGAFTPTFAVADAWGSTGTGTVSLLVVENSNRPPYATLRDPAGSVILMAEQTNKVFSLAATDPEGVPLTYTWELDGTPVSSQPTNHLYQTAWGDAGTHELAVRVSDGLWNNALAVWQVEVSGDNDGDGMSNAWERAHGLDPWSAGDATADPDGDCLVNTQEFALGTSPVNADSNGDSLPDGWSVKFGYDPLDTNVIPRMTLTRRGVYPAFTGTWDRVAAIGKAAYVARGVGGLHVIDATDPDHPVEASSWSSGDFTYDIAVDGNRVYSCDGTNGLVVFDAAADPFHLVGLHRYAYAGVPVSQAAANGNRAYLGLFNAVQNFQVLDVSGENPDPFLGFLITSNGCRDIACAGPFVYVAGGDAEFGIIDASTPSTPLMRGTLPLPVGYQAYCVAPGEGAVFLAWQNRVSAIDVTDPGAPSVIATNELPGNAQIMAMQNEGGFMFVGRNFFMSSGSGLSLYDGASTVWTSVVAQSSADMQVRDLFATPDRVYVIDGTNGLVVYTYVGDYDRDGLPDAWERERLGTTAYGALDDPDHDGVVNLGEWRALLDPADPDTDGDGLTDGWEVRHLMDPRVAGIPGADSDGDGIPDAGEQRCRTSPLDPDDVLRLDAGAGASGSVGITWWGVSGVTYRVDRSWDLGGWFPAPDGPAPDGTNPRTAVQHGWENYVDPEPGAWSNLFYRIQVP